MGGGSDGIILALGVGFGYLGQGPRATIASLLMVTADTLGGGTVASRAWLFDRKNKDVRNHKIVVVLFHEGGGDRAKAARLFIVGGWPGRETTRREIPLTEKSSTHTQDPTNVIPKIVTVAAAVVVRRLHLRALAPRDSDDRATTTGTAGRQRHDGTGVAGGDLILGLLWVHELNTTHPQHRRAGLRFPAAPRLPPPPPLGHHVEEEVDSGEAATTYGLAVGGGGGSSEAVEVHFCGNGPRPRPAAVEEIGITASTR